MQTWTVKILKIASLLTIMACLWYLLLAPSLKLDEGVRKEFHSQWNKLDEKQKANARELAKFDLEKKVYPEIQDRLSKINDWFINKMLFAGGLLGAFLLQLWWPFWSQNISLQERERQAVAIFTDLLRSAPVCAVLGLACVVSLFMDIHIRRSLIVVHQMGAWAAEYGTVALGGCLEQFPAWEQFIRMSPADSNSEQQSSPCRQQARPGMQQASLAQPPNPRPQASALAQGSDPGGQIPNSARNSKPGMHRSLVDAVQTGNLSLMTLVLFAFYFWTFQAVCRQGLDEFNRLTYLLVSAILLAFLLITHLTSGNFEFTRYELTPPDWLPNGMQAWFSNWMPDRFSNRMSDLLTKFDSYFAAWSGITLIMVAWDLAGSLAAWYGRWASHNTLPEMDHQ